MLYRKAYTRLLRWKNEKQKKALCIVGARQIGKTTLVREFAKAEYSSFIEINFITEPSAGAIFAGDLDIQTLIANLTAYARKPMPVGKTLILLDEIQECPNARTAIKFLVEDGRFDYIATGSLLGTRYKEVRSYPVGFEELYYMYPMDFEEFLLANGVQNATLQYLEKCFSNLQSVPAAIHQTICRLFYTYIVVGGMPDIVQTYVNTHDIGQVVLRQKDILVQYRLDITKYAPNTDKTKITMIFDNIPAQLDDKNRRFMLSRLADNARMNRYLDSFKWLEDAGVALPCYNVTAPQLPLTLNIKHNLFKLYMCDTGLLCGACLENIQFAILQGDVTLNMGSILENVMAQQLKSNGFNLNYFDSKRYGELDFVVQNGAQVDLLEIKSGQDYKKHAALDKVLTVKEWEFGKSIVLCKGNIEQDEDIVYLPWYMVMFIKPAKVPPDSLHEVDLSALNPSAWQ